MAILDITPPTTFWSRDVYTFHYIWVRGYPIPGYDLRITVDLKRTNTYLGCIATQVALNLVSLSISIFLNVFLDISHYSTSIITILIGLPARFAMVCSLCLLVISLWPLVMFRTFVPAKKLWRVNTKDALGGAISPLTGLCALSVLGHRRKKAAYITVVPKWLISTRRYMVQILFRRVSPVETRVYAFARNSFAIVAIGILIFRTVTAIQQAQNEIKTRVLSESCDKATSVHEISILSDRLIYDSRWKSSLPGQLNMSVRTVFIDRWSGEEVYNVS
ncbi:unnamed protein product [Rhizoctonia solani]|uniref:Uncharacterized protein n=1 Tax=Rhizoctonia solani TaxID=456999 RepID=A0A8H2WUI8_9AGAM|nr:unnamed protein product [Rhizoctonia solani]